MILQYWTWPKQALSVSHQTVERGVILFRWTGQKSRKIQMPYEDCEIQTMAGGYRKMTSSISHFWLDSQCP